MKEVNQYLTGAALTGKKLKSKKAVVIHWFADPMAKATNVIKWWQGQANGVSAHDVICLDGTVYHAVPYDAMAYQVGCPRGYTKAALQSLSSYPNDCVVGIECAHFDMTGKMTPETYSSLVELSARLLKKFNLTVNDLWLHSEIVGKDYKDCHRWFTTTKPADWPKFKSDVNAILNPAPKVETDSADGKLVRGERGPNVKQLNAWLHELEYTTKTDDLFDQYTEAALKAFQKDHGLTQDAVYVSAIGGIMVKAIEDKKNLLKADAIPVKNPTMYRLAKLMDTTDPKLIEQYKKDGYRIIEIPQ